MLLSSYGNVPSERAANLIGMLLGVPVSAGFVDLASERLSARLGDAGFDAAMQAALGKEPVLAADETPVSLADPRAGLAEEDAGAVVQPTPVRTPGRQAVPDGVSHPELVAELVDKPDEHLTNLGSKGLGEPPIVPIAAAIANAIRDATGADVHELPISREEMLRALDAAKEKERRGAPAAV